MESAPEKQFSTEKSSDRYSIEDYLKKVGIDRGAITVNRGAITVRESLTQSTEEYLREAGVESVSIVADNLILGNREEQHRLSSPMVVRTRLFREGSSSNSNNFYKLICLTGGLTISFLLVTIFLGANNKSNDIWKAAAQASLFATGASGAVTLNLIQKVVADSD